MGFLDKFKKVEKQALDLAGEHKGDIEKGLHKAADLADQQTGHKYSSKIDSVEAKAESMVQKLDAPETSGPQTPAPPQ